MKRRANKLLDYDQARSKTKRADSLKQEKALAEEEQSKRAFEQLDHCLKHDLPILYEVVEGVMRESEEAGRRLQGLLGKEVADGLAFIPDPTSPGQHQMETAMNKIQSLRIAN